MIAGSRKGRDSADGVALAGEAVARQIRRAWAFLVSATLVFALLCGGLFGAGYWYRGHATVKQSACVDVVQGEQAFFRPAYQRNWSAVRADPAGPRCATTGTQEAQPRLGTTILHEGDELQTSDGTLVFLTLWDGSTVQVFEGTVLRIAELRTTQYISRASAFSLNLQRGRVRVSPKADDYSRSRFQVVAGRTTVLMKEGGQRTAGGSFLVEVLSGGDGEAVGAVRASVRRGVGAVRVAGHEPELRLAANEQTIVPANGMPGPPTPARRDLVANGLFTTQAPTDESKSAFAPWQEIRTPGQGGGGFGRIELVRETIDRQPVTAVEFFRGDNSVDSANTGLYQPLGVRVSDLAALELTADVKVLEQNLPGGGMAGSEFPMIVRLDYRDQSGRAHTKTWGFYSLPDPARPEPVAGRLVAAGEWIPLRVDLLALTPQPVRLDAIEVYASGHGYRARITNVAIIGTE